MSDLVRCLEEFNRKERYWVIRNVFASTELSEAFLDRLKEKTGLDVPRDAWWGFDYHIDWIFGALRRYFGDKIGGSGENRTVDDPDYDLVMGSQQDFDFVIAFEKTLIVIEAKATGPWSETQYLSKKERLDRLVSGLPYDHGLDVRFLLFSPDPPHLRNDSWLKLSMDQDRKYFTAIERHPTAAEPKEWILRQVRNPGYMSAADKS